MIELCCEFLFYGAFGCMFLSRHEHILEWIHTLLLPECQGTSYSKHVWDLKFKWLQLNSKLQPFSSWTNTQPFSQTGQLTEMCCEFLSVRCIWLYVLIMSFRRFRVNAPSIVTRISRNSLLKTRVKFDV